ncbi:hypothetical protein CP532_5677 [Ophiocordyceps camponoti-leonardi (nom. inval.)]|nr:hypothetical protein CP532_5677 [Ophiocordyceps camponoti-leonardi (nom. inval.)]
MGLKEAIKTIACLILYCYDGFPTTTELRYPKMNSTAEQSLINNLEVTIRPTSSSPETIVIVVTNANPFPVSFFRDYSPLDPLALRLGMLKVTPQWAEKPMRLPQVRFNRPWPPPLTSTVTIFPGTSMTSEFCLRNLGIHLRTLGVSPVVFLYGHWAAVWKGTRIDPKLFEAPKWAAASGDFVSNNMTLDLSRLWLLYA